MKRILLFASLIVWSGMASAVVYKWVDAQGKLQYGDRPPDGVHAELVEMLGTHTARNTGAQAPAPKPSSQPPKQFAATNDAPDDQTKKEVDADVAQTREKQCSEAQDRYKKLIEGRRIYKTGDNGERQYLTSDEVDSERLNAKRDVDGFCTNPS